MIKTHTPKAAEITHEWYLIDAEGQTLGRLATKIATILNGKHKTAYSPHLDMADNIVVINAAKIKVTGNKLTDKIYYRHSGYPGGIKQATLAEMMERKPTKVIEMAVKRMLPQNKLNARRMSHLKVFAGPEHTHEPQKPTSLTVSSRAKSRDLSENKENS
jgi:large subunit ribosomal protein L13